MLKDYTEILDLNNAALITKLTTVHRVFPEIPTVNNFDEA